MKKIFRCACLILFVVVVVVNQSEAKGLPSNFITVKLGGFFPQSSDLDDLNADTGFNGEISLGHYIAPGFSVEGALGYFETEGRVSAAGIDVNEKFKVIPLTLSLRGHVPYGRFEPYGFLGIGVYFVEDEISGSIPGLGLSGSDSDDDTALGFHIGLGGTYTFPNNVFLGVEARYLFVETDTFGVDYSLDGIALTGNIGYRF